MKILSIEHALPARRLTNAWVRERVQASNRDTLSPDDLALVDAKLMRFFASAGTEIRYAVDEHESAPDLCLSAGRAALDTAGMAPADVELLLYVGVCRGWIEPAMANVVESELGLVNATCFDVVDACASWLRAMQIAHRYLCSGVVK
ncbi:MAG: hypothetical protein ABIR79_10650 [Candidatus Binatia bacterium]